MRLTGRCPICVRRWGDQRRGWGLEFFAKLPVLTSFALTLMLTLVLPSLMERLRLPRPVGYILAGIILGPQLLAILTPEGKVVAFFAELGKLLLMFYAGFDVSITQFRK